MILPPPQDLAAFVRGEEVRVRVRMEPQPDGFVQTGDPWCFVPSRWREDEEEAKTMSNPLGPPGTRHAVHWVVPANRGNIAELDSRMASAIITTPEPPVREADGWWWSAKIKKCETPACCGKEIK